MTQASPSNVIRYEGVAVFLACAITVLEAFITVAPYFGLSPGGSDVAIITQQQTLLQTAFVAIVSFYFGSSISSRAKDTTIGALAPVAGGVPKSALDPPDVPSDAGS